MDWLPLLSIFGCLAVMVAITLRRNNISATKSPLFRGSADSRAEVFVEWAIFLVLPFVGTYYLIDSTIPGVSFGDHHANRSFANAMFGSLFLGLILGGGVDRFLGVRDTNGRLTFNYTVSIGVLTMLVSVAVWLASLWNWDAIVGSIDPTDVANYQRSSDIGKVIEIVGLAGMGLMLAAALVVLATIYVNLPWAFAALMVAKLIVVFGGKVGFAGEPHELRMIPFVTPQWLKELDRLDGSPLVWLFYRRRR